VQQKQPQQPAPQRSRRQAVRACGRARAHRSTHREGGSCGGGSPAGGAGGAGRRTVASLASVAIAASGAAVAAAVAGSSAPLWRGCDHSDRWRRIRRARGERGVGNGRIDTSGCRFAGPANGIEGVPLLQALLALRAHLRSRRVLKMSRTEVKLRIRINWSSAKSARQSIWTPTTRDERDLHIQAPRCSGRRNDRIPQLLPHADEACNSDQLDPCKSGWRFEPAQLRRPMLTPRPATRRRDKTTQ